MGIQLAESISVGERPRTAPKPSPAKTQVFHNNSKLLLSPTLWADQPELGVASMSTLSKPAPQLIFATPYLPLPRLG